VAVTGSETSGRGRPASTSIDEILDAAWRLLLALEPERLLHGLTWDAIEREIGAKNTAPYHVEKAAAGTSAGSLPRKRQLVWLLVDQIEETDFVARTGIEIDDGRRRPPVARHSTREHLEELLQAARAGRAKWPDSVRETARATFMAALHQRAESMRLRMLWWSQHHDPLVASALRGRFSRELRQYVRIYQQVLDAFDRRLVAGASMIRVLDELAALEDGFILRAQVDRRSASTWADRFADAVVRVLQQLTEAEEDVEAV
jgi:hypothetical protein